MPLNNAGLPLASIFNTLLVFGCELTFPYFVCFFLCVCVFNFDTNFISL